MPADRQSRAQGKAPAKLSAKQRIAAQQAARKRAESRRRVLITGGAITAVLAAFAALVAVKLTTAPATQTGSESAPRSGAAGRPCAGRGGEGPEGGSDGDEQQPGVGVGALAGEDLAEVLEDPDGQAGQARGDHADPG